MYRKSVYCYQNRMSILWYTATHVFTNYPLNTPAPIVIRLSLAIAVLRLPFSVRWVVSNQLPNETGAYTHHAFCISMTCILAFGMPFQYFYSTGWEVSEGLTHTTPPKSRYITIHVRLARSPNREASHSIRDN